MTKIQKNAKKPPQNITQMRFFTKSEKKETKIFAFCNITFELIKIYTWLAHKNNHLNLSFVKDVYVVGKEKLGMVIKRPFVLSQFLVISLYILFIH